MAKKVNQLKWGSMLSYLQMSLGIIIGLLYTPVMIRLLGQSEYGLYNTVSSTISIMSVLSLGFNSSYIRYYSKYKIANDNNSIYKLNGLFLIIFSVIGIVALICGIFLSFNLNLVFNTGLTSTEYATARILTLLLTLNLAISFPMSIFSNIISANEKFIFLKLLGMMKTVLSPFVTLPLLFMGYRSIAIVSVTVAIALLTDSIYMFYVFKVLKNKFVFHNFEKGIFASLFTYTVFIAMNLIIDQINVNIDKLLLARYKGTTAVAIYSVGFSLYGYYVMFSTSVSSVFTPRIHKIVNTTQLDPKLQRKELTDIFTKVGRIQFLVLGLIASGLVFFGKTFIVSLWAGAGYDDSYIVALLLILPASIALIQNIGIEIQRAENKHQFRSIAYLIMAIVNLVLSIFLCQLYGAIGSAIGTAISLVLANGLIMNIYYHKKCNIDILYFWKNIIRISFGLILPCVLGIIFKCCFKTESIILFFVQIILYIMVYCASMWFFGMNNYEKGLVKKPINKALRRKSRD